MAAKPLPNRRDDNDLHKGAEESDQFHGPSQVSFRGQLNHRTDDELLKNSDTDFPEPGSNPEHSCEPEVPPKED